MDDPLLILKNLALMHKKMGLDIEKLLTRNAEFIFSKKKDEYKITVSLSNQNQKKLKEIFIGETPFFIVTFICFFTEEFGNVVPYKKLQLAIQEYRKTKKKFSIHNLRTSVNATNHLFKEENLPILIQSKREEGYFISLDTGKILIDEDYKIELSDIAWRIYLGNLSSATKGKGASSRILEKEVEYQKAIHYLLKHENISEMSMIRDTISIFSTPDVFIKRKEIRASNKTQASEIKIAMLERRKMFLQKLRDGMVYQEVINKEEFEKSMIKQLSNSSFSDLKCMFDEIKSLIRYENYYLFPAETELPFSLLIINDYFCGLGAQSMTKINDPGLILFGKRNVMVTKAIFNDVYSSQSMSRWRSLKKDKKNYILEINYWLDNLAGRMKEMKVK